MITAGGIFLGIYTQGHMTPIFPITYTLMQNPKIKEIKFLQHIW